VISLAAGPHELFALRDTDPGVVFAIEIDGEFEIAPTGVELDADTESMAYNAADGEYYASTLGPFLGHGDPIVVSTFDPYSGDVTDVASMPLHDDHFTGVGEIMFGPDGIAYITFNFNYDKENATTLFYIDLESESFDILTQISTAFFGEHHDVRAIAPRSEDSFWGSLTVTGDHVENILIPFGSFRNLGVQEPYDPDYFDPLPIDGVESNADQLVVAPAACPADVNADGNLDILDFVAFQLLFVDQDPAADCDDNASFNILDFVCFQQLFQAGCL
jgi:hypothetical protein